MAEQFFEQHFKWVEYCINLFWNFVSLISGHGDNGWVFGEGISQYQTQSTCP
jgi:hypothetical protein